MEDFVALLRAFRAANPLIVGVDDLGLQPSATVRNSEQLLRNQTTHHKACSVIGFLAFDIGDMAQEDRNM